MARREGRRWRRHSSDALPLPDMKKWQAAGGEAVAGWRRRIHGRPASFLPDLAAPSTEMARSGAVGWGRGMVDTGCLIEVVLFSWMLTCACLIL